MASLRRLRPPPPGFTKLGEYLGAITALTALIYWVANFHTSLSALPEPPHPEATILQSHNAGPANRTNLVVAVVGDTSMHARWMEGFQNASWDIACIYTGSQVSNFTCHDCVHVEHNQGAKWQLLYSFTQSAAWKDTYQHHYQTVYIPDDDILQTTTIVDRAFSIHKQYNLAVSQPVLCSWMESHSASWDIVKSATTVLRYTNFVEIMVPLFSMDVFRDMVIPTIAFAETGWGLDWLWPFLLGYPARQVAFIDDVCVIHPQKELQDPRKVSMYSVMQRPYGEEYEQYARWGYDADSTLSLGMPVKVQKTLGQVWHPWYADLLHAAGLQDANELKLKERDVKLVVNASAHQQRLLASQQAKSRLDDNGTAHTNLVVVTGQPMWLPANANASWDLIAVQGPDTPVSCPACLLTFNSTAPGRYEQLRQLAQSDQWKALPISRYQYIYLPEGDVYQTGHAINRIFEMMLDYDLLLAHPSVCSERESLSHIMALLKCQPHNVLRYTTAVDVIAPAFDINFFLDSVILTLDNATYGHGLQWLWPFMLAYEPGRTAILDDICIVHPYDELQQALQVALATPSTPSKLLAPTWLPYWSQTADDQPKAVTSPDESTEIAESRWRFQPMRAPGHQLSEDEIHAQLSKFGYKPELYGIKWRSSGLVEYVFQPWYQELLDMGSIQVTTFRTLEHKPVRQPTNKLHVSTSVTHKFTDLSFLQ